MAAGPTPHVWSSTTATADHIYRMGGNGTPSMERYDPATNTWETLAPMPSAVFWGEAVHINGKIYFAGGIGAGGNIFVYDIAANAWETRPGAPSLTFPNVNVLDGIIYAVNLTTTHAYTPSTNTWVQVSPHPTGLYRGASTVFGARIIHLGGRDGLLSDVTNAVQSFRPAYAGNHAPIVNFGAYGTREEGVEILFDATYSDPDGDAVSSWSWNFGDGETSDLQSVNHTYASPGSYTVTLTASDGDLSTTKTRTVVINPAIPNPIGAFGAAWNAGTSAVDLEWTFSGDGYEPSRAEVQRQNWNIYSSAYEAWHVPSGLELDLNSASDGSVNANMQYRYRVRSCRQTRCGAWVVGTAIKTADLPGTSTISAAPFAPGMLLLTFTVAAGEDYYEIARRSRAVTTDPWSAWSTVGSVTDADPLIDSGLPTNSIYQYRVRTCNYAGCSAWSLSQPRRVP